MSYATTDLTDAHPEAFQVAEPIFRDFGGRLAFHGPDSQLG
ncbi:MAG TPA: ribonuclease, partial [Gammaproteobacteria bacterium]|nr:ribonuclease [Gammaproteobacteria bacterium]